jgi:hypothetical protein
MNVPHKLGTLSADGICMDHALSRVTGEYRYALTDEPATAEYDDIDVEVEAD